MFELPERAKEVRARVEAFFLESILPNNGLWHEQVAQGEADPAIEVELRKQAKALGLWNMALPRLGEDEPGYRLSNLEFTAVAEVLGRLEWASKVFKLPCP